LCKSNPRIEFNTARYQSAPGLDYAPTDEQLIKKLSVLGFLIIEKSASAAFAPAPWD